MRERPTVTHEITDDDRTEARRRWRAASWDPDADNETVLAQALADARFAGFAAGLEERADEAHLAGYAEGLADGVDKGKASGFREGAAASRAVFEALFAGGPDTSIRTVWDESQAVPALGIGPLECASVPMNDLRGAFDEAERLEA